MSGIRHIRGRLVPDENGMPVVQMNHDDLVRAAWELTMEKFFPAPKPPSRWQRLKAWLKPSERGKKCDRKLGR